MWVTEEVSLVEFYQSCLGMAREAGYDFVLSFIAREADAPRAYDDIVRAWQSLDDLTGPRILFLFAGNSIRERLESENIYREAHGQYEHGRLLFSPDVALLSSSKKESEDSRRSMSRSIYSKKPSFNLQKLRDHTAERHPMMRQRHSPLGHRHARHRPDRPDRMEIARSQTSQIREIRDHLSLRESDVPCLHLTFLDGGEYLNYKLHPEDNVYNILKVIVETIESNELTDLRSELSIISRNLVSVREQAAKLEGASESIEEVFVRVIATLRDVAAEGLEGRDQVIALEKALLDLTQDPTEQRRRAAFTALREVRDALRTRSFWRDLKSGVQRVIDLAATIGPLGNFSDTTVAFRKLNENKAAQITLLKEKRLSLEARKAALLQGIAALVSPRGVRKRVKAALSDDLETSLETFIVVAARQEMNAVRSYLDSVGASREIELLSDTWSAERVSLQADRRLEFGLIQAPGQGVEDMGGLLDFLQSRAKPKSVLMVGMMAGIPRKSRLLDVQAPRNIVNGTRLGTRDGRIVAEPHGRDVDPVMHNRLQSIDQGRRSIGDISLVTHKHSICVSAKFDDLTPELAQAALAADPENIVGIEMEGSALTARQASQRRSGENTGYLMIKGVADYAGEKASGEEIVQLKPALQSEGAADIDGLLKDPDPTTNKPLKSALQRAATIRALRVALALIEEGQN